MASHDTGEDYPLLDIYPKFALRTPATIFVNPIMQPPQPNWLPGRDPARILRRKTFQIYSTGVIMAWLIGATDTALLGNPNAAASCLSILGSANMQGHIKRALDKSGVVYLNSCINIRPYVHIAIADILDPDERLRLESDFMIDENGDQIPEVELHPITNWVKYSHQILINGFYWYGDNGAADNQFGRDAGYVDGDNVIFGDNRIGGSYSPYVAPKGSDGKKFIMEVGPQTGAIWEEYIGPGTFNDSYYTVHVSSSTSVVKNGVCNTDTKSDRWSAVGTTSGRMIFMSSTGDGHTSANELCTYFKILGSPNAMRLDGGGSAGMVYQGKFLNPLTGINLRLFGQARHIPYALKISNY